MVKGEIKERNRANRKRDKIIRAWLSEDEYNLLLSKCDKSNMSISSFIRKVITDGEIRQYGVYAINEIMQAINNIGNDINGIAKKVNERGSVIEADNEELRNQYEKLFSLILDKIMGIN